MESEERAQEADGDWREEVDENLTDEQRQIANGGNAIGKGAEAATQGNQSVDTRVKYPSRIGKKAGDLLEFLCEAFGEQVANSAIRSFLTYVFPGEEAKLQKRFQPHPDATLGELWKMAEKDQEVFNAIQDFLELLAEGSESQLRQDLQSAIQEMGFGSHEAAWLSFYDFFLRIGVEECRSLEGLMEIAKSCGWWSPYDEVVLLQDRHCELHRNDDGALHNPNGMAVKYPDGFGVYAMNGVHVPDWLVETPAEQLDARKIRTIRNAEVRREFVNKLGTDRLVHNLDGETIDEKEVEYRDGKDRPFKTLYKVLLLDCGGDEKYTYLQMENPSLEGTFHVEGVPNNCRTVDAALEFRNGTSQRPTHLS